jgi:hypothetical protein
MTIIPTVNARIPERKRKFLRANNFGQVGYRDDSIPALVIR